MNSSLSQHIRRPAHRLTSLNTVSEAGQLGKLGERTSVGDFGRDLEEHMASDVSLLGGSCIGRDGRAGGSSHCEVSEVGGGEARD